MPLAGQQPRICRGMHVADGKQMHHLLQDIATGRKGVVLAAKDEGDVGLSCQAAVAEGVDAS